MRKRSHRMRGSRRGTTLMEVAVTFPVFFLFICGLVEVSRIQTTSTLLKTACRSAARYGTTEGATSAEVKAKVAELVGKLTPTDQLVVLVKDGSVYDDPNAELPTTAGEYEALPDIELAETKPTQLFIVRATVRYQKIRIFDLAFIPDITLTGQTFMRHE